MKESLRSSLASIVTDLDDLGVRWAVIGGLAVSARTEPRLTRDVDVAVEVTGDPEAERLIADLRARGYEIRMVIEQTAAGRMSTVRLVPRRSAALVDLLFASSGIEPEVVAAADRIEVVRGLVAPVARCGHLVALKLLARNDRDRPQDLDDLRSLLATATPADVDLARAAVRLIRERGFDRGRDLEGALDALLAERA